MIICPRCGYQAPDGSPWCPRCGYGCPYPIQYQQQPPQQMPVPYQPQPIPAQYDVVDIPPQPDPVQTPKRRRKKKKTKKWVKKLGTGCVVIAFIFISFIILIFTNYSNKAIEKINNEAKTPQNVETMVSQMMDQTATAEQIAMLSATPTFTPKPTNTTRPTMTPKPSRTPVPTNTPVPVPDGFQLYTVQEGENCWSIARDYGISEDYFRQINNMTSCRIAIGDQVLVPDLSTTSWMPAQPQTQSGSGSGYLGAVAQDTTTTNTCAVKVSKNGIYHCSNSPNYNTMKEYTCFSSQAAAEAAGYRMSGNQGGWCAQ